MALTLGQVFWAISTRPGLPQKEEMLRAILEDPAAARLQYNASTAYIPPAEIEAGSCPIGLDNVGEGGRCQQMPDMPRLSWSEYDKVIVGFSGGKDSVACVLTLYERLVDEGIDPRKVIELWHHNVDGSEREPVIWDWPCTESYCRTFAEHLGLPFLIQYRKRGIHGEMWRTESCSEPVVFQTWDETGENLVWVDLGAKAAECRKVSTRRRFPQVSADLNTRWCTAYVKIMVADAAIAGDPRFKRGTFMMVTGERRQESNNRSTYSGNQPHRKNTVRRQGWAKVRDVWLVGMEGEEGPSPADGLVAQSSRVRRFLGESEEAPGWSFLSKQRADSARRQLVEQLLVGMDEGATSKTARLRAARALVGSAERWEWVDAWERGNVVSGKEPGSVKRGRQVTARYFDHHRPILDWREMDVWEVMRRWGIQPHPCYWLGISRASCRTCIFLTAADWASLRIIDPKGFERHRRMEAETGYTLHREFDLQSRANQGRPFVPLPEDAAYDVLDHNKRINLGRDAFEALPHAQRHVRWARSIFDFWRPIAMGREFSAPIWVDPTTWFYPPGAFRHSGGPE